MPLNLVDTPFFLFYISSISHTDYQREDYRSYLIRFFCCFWLQNYIQIQIDLENKPWLASTQIVT